MLFARERDARCSLRPPLSNNRFNRDTLIEGVARPPRFNGDRRLARLPSVFTESFDVRARWPLLRLRVISLYQWENLWVSVRAVHFRLPHRLAIAILRRSLACHVFTVQTAMLSSGTLINSCIPLYHADHPGPIPFLIMGQIILLEKLRDVTNSQSVTFNPILSIFPSDEFKMLRSLQLNKI